MKQMTTVKVRRETKKMLADMGKKEDTYDDVIMRLIEFYNKNSKVRERKT
jgi:predicted CopG family antitoxin